jgi:hypothetical protein
MRKASEELALLGFQESICARHGEAETENMEELFHSGGEAGFDGEYQLVSDLSVGVGEDRDEGDQGSENPREVDIGLGVFGFGEMDSPYVRKGLERQKNTVFVSKFVECEQDSKGYWGLKMTYGVGVRGMIL